MPTRAFVCGNDENSPPSNDQGPPLPPSLSKRSTKKLKCKSWENAKTLFDAYFVHPTEMHNNNLA